MQLDNLRGIFQNMTDEWKKKLYKNAVNFLSPYREIFGLLGILSDKSLLGK